jgi:hypothetical protein
MISSPMPCSSSNVPAAYRANHACLHQWAESNPVLPWLRLIKERRDPILLPTQGGGVS